MSRRDEDPQFLPRGDLSRQALEALVEGQCAEPFSVLGPQPEAGGWRVTLWVPGAARLWLLLATDAGEIEVEAVAYPGLDGVYEQHLAVNTPYRLRAMAADGTEWRFDDPYRFGPVLGEIDEFLIGEGKHHQLWHILGAHLLCHEGAEGVHFALWAPHASVVALVGDFNFWDDRRHPMRRRGATGVWELFVPGLAEGAIYKFALRDAEGGRLPLKADPLGFGAEHPPATASVVRRLATTADDGDWPAQRPARNHIDAPISIYEVQLGSWRRGAGNSRLSYAELAEQLVDYACDMGFSHIELLPITEYPFDGSWGYQPIGLFAPTSRHGTAAEFRAFVAAAHRRGLGVILDWVPGHFPSDAHGLGHFDGTALYEHADPREGFHHDWNTLIYNYGRAEVKNYLTANALYWLEEYALDGLRVDAVASMLYRDYSRQAGQWLPNKDGGRENYEAIAMLQETNVLAYGHCPGIMTVAEESTSFPGVTKPVDQGGLGFGYKWNMGWMNDVLAYWAQDPLFRKFHHDRLTFGLTYAWSENFILPISHDEVVHGKGSMLGKMPGDSGQAFANLRAFYGFMWGHPGKKLLFMGQEFAQAREWNHDQSLDWHLLEQPAHLGVQRLVRDLNQLYRSLPALHVQDCVAAGFAWLLVDAAETSVLAWLRFGAAEDAPVLVVVNLTPVTRQIQLSLPRPGRWREILNTDAAAYGGQNIGNFGGVTALAAGADAQDGPAEAVLTLPGLSTLYLTPEA